jgi:hypothetical protein
MNKLSESERIREQIKSRREDIQFLESLYKKGAGCFGVPRRSPDVKKELNKLRKKGFDE